MTILTTIEQLRATFPSGEMYAEQTLGIRSTGSIFNEGFMGSKRVVVLVADKSIYQDAPGCLAAPKVTLTAKIGIELGMEGQKEFAHPLRLYAPDEVKINAPHVSIGDLQLVQEPLKGSLSCKVLTLSKSKREEPDSFEIIKSWAVDDTMEIEIIPPLDP